ncbi:MAG: hypothetical protein KIT89_07445 [Microcella sp.]|uniref:hypothetical protein n=1 Tax=Microcella sp. TaxID=1913979 RepID=UPI0024CA7B48|nr:hypothetical protein [Microcella sp.]UYN82592.1 MAG: hypothetical protein KIT89_07445 [Microcella sp.]
MKAFARWLTTPFRNYVNRRLAALHEHLSRIERRFDQGAVDVAERELTELREVNQALLDSVHILTESVSKLRDEVHAITARLPEASDR